MISSDLCNAIKKILDKISCHRDRNFTVSIEIGQNTVIKILPKKLYCDFKLSLQCNQENTGQNFVS